MLSIIDLLGKREITFPDNFFNYAANNFLFIFIFPKLIFIVQFFGRAFDFFPKGFYNFYMSFQNRKSTFSRIFRTIFGSFPKISEFS